MPIARFQMPDGRVARFEVPEGTSPEQAQQMIAAQISGNKQPAKYDPTADMTTSQKVLAGIGRGMTGAVQAVGQGISKLIGAEDVGAGLVKQEDIDYRNKLDEALMKTRAGKIGSGIGTVAIAAPTALIPGANTYTGAALIGGAAGGLMTEGGLEDRAKGALFGAAGGAAGKGLGDALGWAIPKVTQAMGAKRAVAETANAQKDAAALAAREAGYVLPPADVRPNLINEALGGLSGKIKTAQVASARNQEVTNSLARRALGIADDSPLTVEALDAFRKQAAAPYREIAGMGEFNAAGASLPKSVSVSQGIDPLMMGKTAKVDAGELVRAWKQSNHDATAYFRAYARDANPETLAKAQAASSAAKQIDDFLTTSLESAGKGGAADALKEARRQIAKSYTVEKALNGSTGDVSAQVLAKELAKGKKLSGDLLDIAKAGQAFPKATQALKETPKAMSPLDFMAGLMGAGSSGPIGALAVGARPAVRSLLLSKGYQGLLATPQSYNAGLIEQALPLLANEQLRRGLPIAGGLLSADLAQ